MITSIEAQRLLIVSDVHLGNRLFHARRPFIQFLRYVCDMDSDLCINGDGIDISQLSLRQITRDISACSSYLRQLAERNLRVYFVVGNHDIVLENFLDDWGVIGVVPFLNVTCGETRIHIEHGHLFDHSFVQFPRIYTFMTSLGRHCLNIHPLVYKGLEKMKPIGERLRRMAIPSVFEECQDAPRIPLEPVGFYEAAAEIARHGFDYVIMGHTHLGGQVSLPDGATYMNTGSWLFDPLCVEIDNGQVRMHKVGDLIQSRSEGDCWFDFARKET